MRRMAIFAMLGAGVCTGEIPWPCRLTHSPVQAALRDPFCGARATGLAWLHFNREIGQVSVIGASPLVERNLPMQSHLLESGSTFGIEPSEASEIGSFYPGIGYARRDNWIADRSAQTDIWDGERWQHWFHRSYDISVFGLGLPKSVVRQDGFRSYTIHHAGADQEGYARAAGILGKPIPREPPAPSGFVLGGAAAILFFVHWMRRRRERQGGTNRMTGLSQHSRMQHNERWSRWPPPSPRR